MAKTKKPVVFVGIALGALIVVPLFVLFWANRDVGGGGNGGAEAGGDREEVAPGSGGSGDRPPTPGNGEMDGLAERARSLLEEDLAEALRAGKVSLDFVMRLRKDMERADSALASGDRERARGLYEGVATSAEERLESLKKAEQARKRRREVAAELERLKGLKTVFENTYGEARRTHETAVAALRDGRFAESLEGFGKASEILGSMESRAENQVGGLLEAGRAALEGYRLEEAESAFEAVLKIEEDNAGASKALEEVRQLREVASELEAVARLEEDEAWAEALERLRELAERFPENGFLQERIAAVEDRRIARRIEELLAEAESARQEGDFERAKEALDEAAGLRQTAEIRKQREKLKEERRAEQLEKELAGGYEALQAGRYKDARDHYRKAVDIDSDSEEARRGLEKASSLFMAGIRYEQNLESARKLAEKGRYPLAAEFFNKAMDMRPGTVSPSLRQREKEMREMLERQSEKVPVVLESDNRTYVSIIGVLPTERFRRKELRLFPDVYTVKGSREGYRDVERELKVDARNPGRKLEIKATEKQ